MSFNPAENRTCIPCSCHVTSHHFDPRCSLCIVERIRAIGQAAVILVRCVLPLYA